MSVDCIREWLTCICLVGVAAFTVAWLVLANRSRLTRAADRIAKTPRSAVAAFLFFVAIATVCAQKQGGTNAPPNGASSPRDGSAESRSEGGESPMRGGGDVSNLCFTAISTSSNSVVLSLAWPTNFLADGSCLDFFAKSGSLTNGWAWIGCQAVAAADTNLDVEVFFQQIAPSATNMPAAAFFLVSDRETSAATMNDADGDGIPDVYELHNGTNPYIPDGNLVPRLTVGDGGAYSNVVAALAASTNYSVVALSAGEYDLGQSSLVMPNHPVMLTGPEDGYAVLRSAAGIGAIMLADGQDEETLFRNLYVVLEARRNFQAGFWIGGNLPWSGIGASPTFENVRVRAPCPGTLYYGWHYYCDNGGRSIVSNCVMNAAGAENAIGVYSKGGPCVSVVDCRFVNFAQTNSNFATYFDDGVFAETNVVSEWASQEPELSWAGYPTNVCYSAVADSDGDGMSDYNEIFTYDTDPWLSDSDGDGVSDSQEVEDGTDPRVFGSFLRHVTVVVTADDSLTSVTNYVSWGTEAEGWTTNGMVALVGNPETNAFVFAPSLETVYVKAYRDLNQNSVYDSDVEELYSVLVNGNSATIDFRFSLSDRDQDGILDWWETLHADAGFSPTNSTDAWLDLDGDGLINLHEYLADCDPLAYDGTNTAIYAAVHGVDDRISNTVASVSTLYFSGYSSFLDQWHSNHTNSTLATNPQCWMSDIDMSFMSVACDDSQYPYGHPLAAISPVHVISASHVMISTNILVAFRTPAGDIINRRVVATNVIFGVANNDLCVGILDAPLPDSISKIKFLPTNYKAYIGDGARLPQVRIGRDKSCSLHDILRLSPNETSASMTRLTTALSAQRRSYARAAWAMDSGHPIFLLLGNDVVYLCPASGYYSDGLASGYLCTKYLSMIQDAMDDLSVQAGKDIHELQTFSFTPYAQLSQ